ncbi:MAG: hypothetical protein BMS9Abin07_1642 [Acidimicrobiia bacterium]|nr:MAG: hypothetical protein BMS9Abin07_1642 [Acidimicrobiia bacterium]
MAVPQAPKRTIGRSIGVVVAFFIAAVLAVALLLANLPSFNLSLPSFIVGEPFEEVGLVVVDELQELAELTTVEMVETTTIQRGDDHGILNLALGDRLFLFAAARIGAGVDLSKLTEDSFAVNQETGTLAIEIPRAEIFYTYLDSDSTTVLDRDTGLLTKGDDQLESVTRADSERILQAQAIEAGILDRAQTSAETFLTGFFTSLGYTEVVVRTIVSP